MISQTDAEGGLHQSEQALQAAIEKAELDALSNLRMMETENGIGYELVLARGGVDLDVDNLDKAVGDDPFLANVERCDLLYWRRSKCEANGIKSNCAYRNDPELNEVNAAVYAKAMGAALPKYAPAVIPGTGVTRDYSQINSEYGWVNAWIPNGKKQAVYVGAHGAFFSANPVDHTCVVVFVTEGSRYFENKNKYPQFINNFDSCQVQYMTIGGEASGPDGHVFRHLVWGHLICKYNRDSDIKMNTKIAMYSIDSSDQTIDNLIEKANNFISNQERCDLTYDPTLNAPMTYNSNSFLRGLLIASNVSNIPNFGLGALGWGTPISSEHFSKYHHESRARKY